MSLSSDLSRRIVRKGLRVARAVMTAYPKLRECNVCGWEGRRFDSDEWHPFTICPNCRSQVRHRLLVGALAGQDELSYARIIDGRTVLHFAPEPVLHSVLADHAAKYVTADYLRDNVDLRLDISDMQTVRSNSFDVVVACDVLEHVPDDRKAMREIHRILSPDGYAILTVPQKDELAVTYEDNSLVTPEERERAFGQWDHLRIYGDDFAGMLESAGFKVTAVDETWFPEHAVRRHILLPPVPSTHPLATNYRKVFFARKLVNG
jgi:SAM-dependent methyltransferase